MAEVAVAARPLGGEGGFGVVIDMTVDIEEMFPAVSISLYAVVILGPAIQRDNWCMS